MDIKHPRRLMFLGAPQAGVLDLISDLTGSAPTPIDGSAAGLSHTWPLNTAYYKAEIPIWIDEVSEIDAWRDEFLKKEAKEVICSLGGWIYCFRRPVTESDLDTMKESIKAVEQVIRKAMGYEWDGTCLAVAMPQSTTPYLQKTADEWEDICREYGFEYIDSEAKGRNEYGEPTGVARLKEAIETTDWTADESPELEDLEDLEFDEDGEASGNLTGYDAELAEMDMELKGLKTSLAVGGHGVEEDEEDQEEQVEEMSRMMTRMQAIKEMGSSMPEAERKKFMTNALNGLMKDIK